MHPILKWMIAGLVAVGLLGIGPVLASPSPKPPRDPDRDHSALPSERVSILLTEIRKETAALLADIQQETAKLSPHPYSSRTFPGSPYDNPQSRDLFLDQAKGHMNAVGERINKLQNIRPFVLPWQQQAISEVTSHATRVAASIRAVIVRLRENHNRLFVSAYRNHLTAIANHSEEMKHSVDKFLDYEKTPKEVHRLQTELEPTGD